MTGYGLSLAPSTARSHILIMNHEPRKSELAAPV